MLFLLLDHRQVDKEENRGDEPGEPGAAGGQKEAGGGDERAGIEGIANHGIRAGGGQPLVLGQVAGGPGADQEPEGAQRQARGQRSRGRIGQPGPQGRQQEAGGHAEARCLIGVRLREPVPTHQAPPRASGIARRAFRCSKTASGRIAAMLSSVRLRRL